MNRIGFCSLLCSVFIESTASAAVLLTKVDAFSITIGGAFSTLSFGYRWDFWREFPRPFPPLPADVQLWSGVRFTPDDVGRSYVASVATDPQFAGAVDFLTDGNLNTIYFPNPIHYTIPNGGGTLAQGQLISDQQALFDSTPNSPIDLRGATISSISMELNEFSFDVVPSLPSHPPGITFYRYYRKSTITFEGTIPEPSGLAIGAIGLVGLKRRLQHRLRS